MQFAPWQFKMTTDFGNVAGLDNVWLWSSQSTGPLPLAIGHRCICVQRGSVELVAVNTWIAFRFQLYSLRNWQASVYETINHSYRTDRWQGGTRSAGRCSWWSRTEPPLVLSCHRARNGTIWAAWEIPIESVNVCIVRTHTCANQICDSLVARLFVWT